jgi:hypothetical protein
MQPHSAQLQPAQGSMAGTALGRLLTRESGAHGCIARRSLRAPEHCPTGLGGKTGCGSPKGH